MNFRQKIIADFLKDLANRFLIAHTKKLCRTKQGKVFLVVAGGALFLSACASGFFGFFETGEETPTDIFSAKLVKVADGDTITVETNNGEKRRVRLFGIDAPEIKQAYGSASRDFLKSIATKNLKLQCQPRLDRYKRFVCDVYNAQNVWLNEALVANGYAWHYKNYSNNPKLNQAQTAAKTARKGLWSMPNPIAPWHWRQQNER